MKKSSSIVSINKKARFNYEILKTYEAGIVLTGQEVKSLRFTKASIKESYIKCTPQGEIFIQNFHITPYGDNTLSNFDAKRIKKLLLHRKEINRLKEVMSQSGLTIIPLQAYFNSRGLLKIEIASAQGKKLHDKRQALKIKDLKKELDRQKYY